jgi:hypothetical protein
MRFPNPPTPGVEDDPLFLLLPFLLALFLFPIAIYFMALGLLNRRPQPLVVSGAWDFLGVLLATSGFLLFVGPALLSGAFRQSLRDLPLQRDSASLGEAISEIWAAWWVVWLLYYLFVLFGTAFLVWTRRQTTVIYNVDPQTMEQVLAQAARRLGWSMDRRGNRYYFGPESKGQSGTEASGGVGTVATELPDQEGIPLGAAVLDLEPFPLLSNISLHWHLADQSSRADLQRELHKAEDAS